MIELDEKLKDLRKKSNLTQDNVAKKLNISRKTLSGWENGRGKPDIDLLKELSQIYDVPIDYFINNNANNTKRSNESTNTKSIMWYVLNIINLLLLFANIIIVFFHIRTFGVVLAEFIIDLILLQFNLKHRIAIKFPYISLTIFMLILFVVSISYASFIVPDASIPSILIASIIKSLILTFGLFLGFVFIRKY